MALMVYGGQPDAESRNVPNDRGKTMSHNVINFAGYKADAEIQRSESIAKLELFLNADNSRPWARVTELDQQDLDAGWHRFIAGQLRQLAWISECMAAEMDGEGLPVGSVTMFDDSRIVTQWNDDLIKTEEQVQWVLDQLGHSMETIRTDEV